MKSKSRLIRPLILLALLVPAASAITLIAYWVYIYDWQGNEWYFTPLIVEPTVNATTLYIGEYINISVDVVYLQPWAYLNHTAYNYSISGPYYDVNRSYYYNGTYYPNETAYLNNQYYNFTVPANISYTVMVNVYRIIGTSYTLYYHTSFEGSIELNITNGSVYIARIHAGSTVVRLNSPGTYLIKVFVWTDYPSIDQTLWASLSESKEQVIKVLLG